MLKDTKSLGNNKAPACESRGFVHKKRGVHFDTPPCLPSILFHCSRNNKFNISAVILYHRIYKMRLYNCS